MLATRGTLTGFPVCGLRIARIRTLSMATGLFHYTIQELPCSRMIFDSLS